MPSRSVTLGPVVRATQSGGGSSGRRGLRVTEYERLQRLYAGDEYYWGKQPNEFARLALNLLPESPGDVTPRAVDIGSGEGRDAVFFAKNGLDTLAVDIAPNGLEKTVRLARDEGVGVRVQRDDINTLRLVGRLDLVYSIGAIQYLEPGNRVGQFGHLRERTSPGGLHALFAFTDHPDVPPAPDWGDDEYTYAPGELLDYYPGWTCLYSRAFVFEDDSGGTVHRHAAEEYVFERPR